MASSESESSDDPWWELRPEWKAGGSGVTWAGWGWGFRSDLFQVGKEGIFVVLPLLGQLLLMRELVTGQLHSDLEAIGV